MDAELREILAGFSSQLANVAHDVRASAEVTRDTSRAVRELAVRTSRLEKHVFGDDLPPGSLPPSAPVVTRVSLAEADADGLRGTVVAIESRLAAVEKMNVDQSRVLDAQSKVMGVGARGLNFLFKSREGRNLVLRLATLILVAIGSYASTVARQAPPAPTSVHGEATVKTPWDPFVVPP